MAQDQLPVRLFASDELGQLKLLQAPSLDRLDALSVVHRWGEVDRSRAVQVLSLGSQNGLADTATATVAVGRKNGLIEVLNPNSGALKCTIDPIAGETPETASIEALHVCFSGPAAAAASPTILSCTAGGTARLHAADKGTSAKELASWKVPATVCCSALEEEAGLLAVGSQGAELRLYNLATPNEPVFAAKGSKPNKLCLVDKPWNSAVTFFPGSSGTKIWTGTGYHKLRLYDTTASKRPKLDIEYGNARITSLAAEPDGNRVWVANAIGNVEVFDVRAGRFSGAIKGIAGSVRELALHPEGKRIASVGLDRFLRVHETSSRSGLGKVYLKTQLTGVAWCPTDPGMIVKESGGGTEERGSEEEQRYEEDREQGGSNKDEKKKKVKRGGAVEHRDGGGEEQHVKKKKSKN